MPARLTPAEAARLLGEDAPKRKYRNVPTVVDGVTFHSKAEARRWGELRLRLRAGEIADLETQPRYVLSVNGVRVATYTADFRYTEDGATVVEDVKSPASRTQQYRLRKRLMAACHNIFIREV